MPSSRVASWPYEPTGAHPGTVRVTPAWLWSSSKAVVIGALVSDADGATERLGTLGDKEAPLGGPAQQGTVALSFLLTNTETVVAALCLDWNS